MNMKIVVAGVGAFGQKHLDAIRTHRRRRGGSRWSAGELDADAKKSRRSIGVPHATTDLADSAGAA